MARTLAGCKRKACKTMRSAVRDLTRLSTAIKRSRLARLAANPVSVRRNLCPGTDMTRLLHTPHPTRSLPLPVRGVAAAETEKMCLRL